MERFGTLECRPERTHLVQRSLRSSVPGASGDDASATKVMILTQVRPRPSDDQAHGRQIILCRPLTTPSVPAHWTFARRGTTHRN